MKKIFIVLLIIFISSNFINANEVNVNSINFNFKSLQVLKQNQSYSSNDLLSQKIELYALSGSAGAKNYFYMGIAGVIIHVVGICMIIPAAVLLGMEYAGKIIYTDPVHRTALLICSGILLGFGILCVVTGVVLACVGFGLFFYYGGKLAYMFNETDYKKGIVSTGLAIRIN